MHVVVTVPVVALPVVVVWTRDGERFTPVASVYVTVQITESPPLTNGWSGLETERLGGFVTEFMRNVLIG